MQLSKDSILFIAVAGVVGFVLGVTLGPIMTGTRIDPSMLAQPLMAPERYFITHMVPHHMDAIAMAEEAKVRSKNQDILALADSIIASQQKEVEQMRTWYEEWYGVPLEMSGTHMGHNKVFEGIAAAEFDRAFRDAMIRHHEEAVAVASMAAVTSVRFEIQELARAIVQMQQAEIEQMRAWEL